MKGQQIKDIVPWNEAYRYLTYLTLQNESNKSLLYQVSEVSVSKEQSKKGSVNMAIKELESVLQKSDPNHMRKIMEDQISP